ncbi:MAG: hypothetical protein ACLTLQ_17680 [[Clostridium] scindens]
MLEAWNTSQVYDPAMHEAIKEQFGYQYPYAGSGMQKLKFTVSELKKRIYLKESLGEELDERGELLYEEPEVVPLIPRFLKEEEELTGASRGTAYHRLMELLDLAQDYGGSGTGGRGERICGRRKDGRGYGCLHTARRYPGLFKWRGRTANESGCPGRRLMERAALRAGGGRQRNVPPKNRKAS